MLKRSKLEEAIKLLKNHGWRVESLPDDKYLCYMGTLYCPSVYDLSIKLMNAGEPRSRSTVDLLDYYVYGPRELIKKAKGYTSNDKQVTKIKSLVKKDSKRERRFVRDELNKHGEEADVNYPKKRYGDPWDFD